MGRRAEKGLAVASTVDGVPKEYRGKVESRFSGGGVIGRFVLRPLTI
jgi:hypothetical protein